MMTASPVFSRSGSPPIRISASPSNTCTRASNGAVCSVDQQRLLDRQPEREGEADAADRKVHAERLGGVADRLAPDEILNGRNVEQRGGEQHRQQDDDQCPKRIFYDFSQHVHNERFRLPQNSSR